MAQNRFGQMITFAIESGGDQKFEGYAYVRAIGKRKRNPKWKKGDPGAGKVGRNKEWLYDHRDTAQKIAARRGHVEAAGRIKNLNNLRSVTQRITAGRRIRVPDRLRQSAQFNVLAGDGPPTIVDGYAKINTVDRSGRRGISSFVGYNPIVLQVPIQFESEDTTGSFIEASGVQIEKDIALLEQMAGRGQFQGEGEGAPPILHVSTMIGDRYVSLIPDSLQRQRTGSGASTEWWISNIEWDANAIRNGQGNRIRQLATVELTEYVAPRKLVKSAAARHKGSQKK